MKFLIRSFFAAVLLSYFPIWGYAQELTDLSKDASYEFQKLNGCNPPDLNYIPAASVNKDFLLKDNPDTSQKFAFQTQKQGRSPGSPSPYIIIKLEKDSIVKKIYIQNRLDENKTWSNDLTVWVSQDQNVWKRIWQAKSIEDEWTIEIPKGQEARFIKVGLDVGMGILSLNKIRIYGTTR